jgi:hypothetical protein
MKFLRETAGNSLLDHKRSDLITEVNIYNGISTTIQKKLAAKYKPNRMFQNAVTDASVCPQRKTV